MSRRRDAIPKAVEAQAPPPTFIPKPPNADEGTAAAEKDTQKAVIKEAEERDNRCARALGFKDWEELYAHASSWADKHVLACVIGDGTAEHHCILKPPSDMDTTEKGPVRKTKGKGIDGMETTPASSSPVEGVAGEEATASDHKHKRSHFYSVALQKRKAGQTKRNRRRLVAVHLFWKLKLGWSFPVSDDMLSHTRQCLESCEFGFVVGNGHLKKRNHCCLNPCHLTLSSSVCSLDDLSTFLNPLLEQVKQLGLLPCPESPAAAMSQSWRWLASLGYDPATGSFQAVAMAEQHQMELLINGLSSIKKLWADTSGASTLNDAIPCAAGGMPSAPSSTGDLPCAVDRASLMQPWPAEGTAALRVAPSALVAAENISGLAILPLPHADHTSWPSPLLDLAFAEMTAELFQEESTGEEAESFDSDLLRTF